MLTRLTLDQCLQLDSYPSLDWRSFLVIFYVVADVWASLGSVVLKYDTQVAAMIPHRALLRCGGNFLLSQQQWPWGVVLLYRTPRSPSCPLALLHGNARPPPAAAASWGHTWWHAVRASWECSWRCKLGGNGGGLKADSAGTDLTCGRG